MLSNCVINLSPDKGAVFRDAFRVLKPGGRLAISDVAIAGCVSGASRAETVQELLRLAGFENVRIEVQEESRAFIRDWMPGSGAEDYIASATIQAFKPGRKTACCGPSCCTREASA